MRLKMFKHRFGGKQAVHGVEHGLRIAPRFVLGEMARAEMRLQIVGGEFE